MKKHIYYILAAVAAVMTAGCDKILDRPQLNTPTDETYWKSEIDCRLYANGFYPEYFVGYGAGWGTSYSALRGYTFDDNQASTGKQSIFENSVPTSRYSVSASAGSDGYLTKYVGPTWNFAQVRKTNIFLNRLETRMNGLLSEEVYNHWHAVASFFKCFAYARLVAVFGDVPYFPVEVASDETETLYKDRDSRILVMDSVYAMLKNDVLVNMRTNDGDDMLNLYVAAAFASRWMLFEGTWQKYHNGDQQAANRYLTLAKEAAEIAINSGQYSIDAPFHDLFGSQNLNGNKECLMYRHFDDAQALRHCIASYSNGKESQAPGPNLALAKSFICQDGKVYQHSGLENAPILTIPNMAKTRDPRFESTFYDVAKGSSSTLLYACKFIDRTGAADPGTNPLYNSNTNTNDAPVIRYAEVLLNWIEAKAELNESEVTQTDIDNSINLLRHRPLDNVALEKGVRQTADMQLAEITEDFDPDRDPDVSPLIWEIRRERRMEFVYEHCRLHDIKRWGKLNYMQNEGSYLEGNLSDNMLGPWVNMQEEMPSYVENNDTNNGKRFVMKEDGTVVTFDGSNAAEMVGYYVPQNAQPRDVFTDRSYCSPVGQAQIQDYEQRGFHLTQTQGW